MRKKTKKEELSDEELKRKKIEHDDKIALSHCKVGKSEDFEPIVWKVETLPEPRLRDKFARDMNLVVCRSWTDVANKQLCFDHVVKVDQIETTTYSFADVAKHYGWSSFDFNNLCTTITPKWLTK